MGPGVASVNSSDRRPGSTRYPRRDAEDGYSHRRKDLQAPWELVNLPWRKLISECTSQQGADAHCLSWLLQISRYGYARQLTRGHVPVSDQALRFSLRRLGFDRRIGPRLY